MSDHDSDEEYSPNPKPIKPVPAEHPLVAKARLYWEHYRRGSMGHYYWFYPEETPPPDQPERPSRPPPDRSR